MYKDFKKHVTPQLERARDDQVKNSTGGYVFKIDKWDQFHRFLILGSEDGSYYASGQEMTKDNAQSTMRCIAEDGVRAVDTIVDISKSGRAPKNDPALFALALAASDDRLETRKYALSKLNEVARIGTHLFHFMQYSKNMRGFGRSLKEAIQNWYNNKPNDLLAYQLVKYQSRDGWSHRDAIRLSHVYSEEKSNLYGWATQSKRWLKHKTITNGLIGAYEDIKREDKLGNVVNLIVDNNLTREMVPTKWLNEVLVWEALLKNMPLTAMLRNLGKMTSIGLLKDFGAMSSHVNATLSSIELLKKARIHPLQVLTALKVYCQGKGIKGSLTWNPVNSIVDTLDDAFYQTFDLVEPTNKNIMLSLDVSGSMSWDKIAGSPLTPRDASAALALVTARTEPNYVINAFSGGMVDVPLSKKDSLNDAVSKVNNLRMGRTDCSLPMLHAIENNLNVDTFIIYTDNETWYGRIHPFEALKKYRQKFGKGKLIVVGMTATQFSIADQNDPGMLDVVGFDTAVPTIMRDFILR